MPVHSRKPYKKPAPSLRSVALRSLLCSALSAPGPGRRRTTGSALSALRRFTHHGTLRSSDVG